MFSDEDAALYLQVLNSARSAEEAYGPGAGAEYVGREILGFDDFRSPVVQQALRDARRFRQNPRDFALAANGDIHEHEVRWDLLPSDPMSKEEAIRLEYAALKSFGQKVVVDEKLLNALSGKKSSGKTSVIRDFEVIDLEEDYKLSPEDLTKFTHNLRVDNLLDISSIDDESDLGKIIAEEAFKLGSGPFKFETVERPDGTKYLRNATKE